MNVKEEECRACIGLDEKHTCNGHAMFEFMKAEKYRCQNCKSLQARVDELEEALADQGEKHNPETMGCPACGGQFDSTTRICIECGSDVDG